MAVERYEEVHLTQEDHAMVDARFRATMADILTAHGADDPKDEGWAPVQDANGRIVFLRRKVEVDGKPKRQGRGKRRKPKE